jgi:chemotaxis signal transduction protein
MRWAHRQAALLELELLQFTVGGVHLAAPFEKVAGVVNDPATILPNGKENGSIEFQGRRIPLLRAENIFSIGVRTREIPGAVIFFRHGGAVYGLAVDSADDLLQITPGDRLYRFPPGDPGWSSMRRPWGFIELGDVPILLVDFGPVPIH